MRCIFLGKPFGSNGSASEAALYPRKTQRLMKSRKGGSEMPKQAKRKPGKGKKGKGIRVGVHFPKAEWSKERGDELHKHLKELAPELVKGLREKTGHEDLAKFNMFKE